MWHLSTRTIRRRTDPEWAGYIEFVGLPYLSEVRSIDSWCNPYVENCGSYEFATLADALAVIEQPCDEPLLPKPVEPDQYFQLFTDTEVTELPCPHPQLKFLGYDLSDWTWTSSLLNCGRWQGVLAPIAQRLNSYGLLSLDDAKLAQQLLPEAWNQDHHAFVTIWALFEVLI